MGTLTNIWTGLFWYLGAKQKWDQFKLEEIDKNCIRMTKTYMKRIHVSHLFIHVTDTWQERMEITWIRDKIVFLH